MKIENNNLSEYIKIMSASSGVSFADAARKMGETPQAFGQKIQYGKMQKTLDYIAAVADVFGYNFKWDFEKK